MAQFAVYRNKNPSTKSTYPFLLDVQTDLLTDLQTRVVIPVTKAAAISKRPLTTLTPIVKIEGDEYVLMTPQLAGISSSSLGSRTTAIPEQRQVIIAALDFLITGI